ncbi:MAG TPA: PilT/PilU family type 4a pilus ATPase [Thermoanaerobaculia bacterium]|nr:PilT/PilU family type 4a pilus ATPase [Thermoanaerobaculia bacterium]
MWPKRRRSTPAEARNILTRLRSHVWASEAERDELLRRVASYENLQAEDVGWMAAEADPVLREPGLAILRRYPFETAAEAVFPFMSAHGEGARRQAMASIEALAGSSLPEKIPAMLAHSNPGAVLAAIDWLKRNPSAQGLDAILPALSASSPIVRRRAFGIVESNPSTRSAEIARGALEDDDEEIRVRAVNLLAKFPDESNIAPLLKRCHNDSPRVQEAAVAALGPLLSGTDPKFNEYTLPLLTDANGKVRQLAARILATQEPPKVADAFLKGFCNVYGASRDRAIEGLRELGPEYIHAFLDRDSDGNPAIAALASSIAITLRTPEVVPHCIRFLSGSDWWLRDRAAQTLAEIRDESGLPALVKMLEDPESDICAAAALGVWGTPKALPNLLEAFKKGTKDLRLEVLDAFARIDDPHVGPLLEEIMKRVSDPLVQEKAVRIIAARAGQVPYYETAAPPSRSFEPLDFRSVPQPSLSDLFRHARAQGASDLHVSVGTRPHLRVNGRLGPLPLPETAVEQMEAWVSPILGPERENQLAEQRQIDFCYKDRELGRFRTNVFFQRKGMNAVFRLVPFEIPTLSDIGFPENLWEITTYPQGLVLVTGPSGCGKTTTLAAIVDRINETRRCHILTIEDPIEYVHTNKESLVNQREVPIHSRSFAKAVRQSLREDPDVILVGEMRDLETISLAITAAETGHLVLGTLHTTTAATTVDRVINAFPPDQQGQIRMMIADSLKVVLSQALLPRRDCSGRVAAFEILRGTGNVSGLIRDGKTFQIPTAIQTGAAHGMMLMDGALMQLVQTGVVEARAAYDRAQRKDAFEPLIAAEMGVVT